MEGGRRNSRNWGEGREFAVRTPGARPGHEVRRLLRRGLPVHRLQNQEDMPEAAEPTRVRRTGDSDALARSAECVLRRERKAPGPHPSGLAGLLQFPPRPLGPGPSAASARWPDAPARVLEVSVQSSLSAGLLVVQ